MIIILKKGTTKEQIADLEVRIRADGLRPQTINGDIKTTVNVLGDTAQKSTEPYESLQYVERV
ncbi:MAG: 3-deoxy-7-phosphoheptulonate synthase, partial [Nanoarchaeota archaeon]